MLLRPSSLRTWWGLIACCLASLGPRMAAEDQPWATFAGGQGPGSGKHVVFITGDDEYESETGMPLLARILAERHGFTCTVLFAINRTTGRIDSTTRDNIPGLEALDHADAMVLFTRFRALPDDQMRHIIAFTDRGKGIIGLRTATHAFAYEHQASSYAQYAFNSTVPGFVGGFGRLVLGETWVGHWGWHGHQSTRARYAPGAAGNPILNGVADGSIWCFTDVYEAHPAADCTPLLLGEVLVGTKPGDPPLPGAKNHPMLPVAWTRTYTGPSCKPSRVFTTTMCGKMGVHADWDNAALRRLVVNAVYWATGLEDRIPAAADVDPVGNNPYRRGLRPQDCRLTP
jgi:hypothetical protein